MVLGQQRKEIDPSNAPKAEPQLNTPKHWKSEKADVLTPSPIVDREEWLNRAIISYQAENNSLEEKQSCASCATITGSLLGTVLGGLIGLVIVGLPGITPSMKQFEASGTVLATTCAGTGIGIICGGVISAVGASRK